MPKQEGVSPTLIGSTEPVLLGEIPEGACGSFSFNFIGTGNPRLLYKWACKKGETITATDFMGRLSNGGSHDKDGITAGRILALLDLNGGAEPTAVNLAWAIEWEFPQ